MTSIMYFLLFAAPFLLTESAHMNLDPNRLLEVFGQSYKAVEPVTAESSNIQVAAVKPDNSTLVDPDYWDFDEFQPTATDYDAFDWAITKRMTSYSEANFLLSPLGLKLALAILTEAATGPTQAELSSVLGFDLDRKVVRTKFAAIIESLKKESPEYILNLGSRIYIGTNALPRQRFAAIAQEFYKTELKTVDFFNPSVAAKEINGWVSNTTHGRIPMLVDENDVTGMIVLILNTIYFKGTWRYQFPSNDTKPGVFYVSAKLQKTVEFMHIKEKFYYAESAKYDAKILRMPYRGNNKFAFYIIVPNTLTGLPRVFNDLSELQNEMSNLQERLVEVAMPKFKFEYASKLDDALREMGVRQAFEDTASFPGIARGQLLYQRLRVSKVIQKCGFEINEFGSVAYAATEVGIVNKFGEDSNKNYEVIVNKPFLFFIQDEITKQLLFTGRVTDPSLVDY